MPDANATSVPCSKCSGSGRKLIYPRGERYGAVYEKCPTCNGTAWIDHPSAPWTPPICANPEFVMPMVGE